MNKIILIGNLTRDPESSTTPEGVAFTRFNIAVNRPFTNAAGERVADYFNIIAWRQLAERCAKYLYKGSKVGIHGSVQRREYEDRDGIKRTSFTVMADEIEFLTPRQSDKPQENHTAQNVAPSIGPNGIEGMQPVDDDDCPF